MNIKNLAKKIRIETLMMTHYGKSSYRFNSVNC